MIRFQCPLCGQPYQVLGAAAGKVRTCGKCGERMRIPEPERGELLPDDPAKPEPAFRADGPIPPSMRGQEPAPQRELGGPASGPKPINHAIPEEYRGKLRAGENAYDFAYVDFKGGCGSMQSGVNRWILITDQRILYEASVRQPGQKVSFRRDSGSIPVAKVSFVGTSTVEHTEGCDNRRFHLLRINSGGGEVELVIPTAKEAKRLQQVIDDLVSTQ